MPKALNSLQQILGHCFRDENLLLRALTHSSLAHERVTTEEPEAHARAADHHASEALAAPEVEQDNERLEFLGDAALGLIVADALFRRFPYFDEGEWSRLRASLVSRSHLARIAMAARLGDYLRLGRGEERGGGRTKAAILANSLEAVIAAIYLDGGIPAASAFVIRRIVDPFLGELSNAVSSGAPIGDHKSALQELLQAAKAAPPRYSVKAQAGPDHRKRFLVEALVSFPNRRAPFRGRGIGVTKKKAEQEAARRALGKLRKVLEEAAK